MPDYQLYTNEAARRKVTLLVTSLALSKLRFFQNDLVLTAFTTKAQLVASEATFDGYTATGYTLTAWTGPSNAPGGGSIETSPMVVVTYTPDPDEPVGNVLGGWWVEDATGNVRIAGVFEPVRPMNVLGNSFPFVIQVVEARNVIQAPVENP